MGNAYNKAGADPINEYHINNTEADLMAHLAPGQFGFATDTYRIVVNVPDGGSGIIKSAEIHTANLSALSGLDTSAGFIYQTGSAAFTKYPFAGDGTALSVAHSDHAHAGVYATGSLSVGKIPYCSNATGPVLSDTGLLLSDSNKKITFTSADHVQINVKGSEPYGSYGQLSVEGDTAGGVASSLSLVAFSSQYSGSTKYGLPFPNLTYLGSGSNSSALLIFQDGNLPIVFGTNNVERMRIAGNGNIGLGTTNPNASLNFFNPVEGTPLLSLSRVSNSAVKAFWASIDASENTIFKTTNADIYFKTIWNAGDPLTTLAITAFGTVGIHTETPVATLDVHDRAGGDLFSFTNSNSVLRSKLPSNGRQEWYINNGVAEVGKIAYSTPGGLPGIIFYNGATYDQNRFNLSYNGVDVFGMAFDADGNN